MPARIYQIKVEGEDDDWGHLHVVVIDIDAHQRLFIPAYDTQGPKITQLCDALHKQGIFEGVGWVEIDNAKEITFQDPKWTGKLARWVSYKRRRIDKRKLGKPIGEMSDRAFARIVECLLKMHAEKPEFMLTEPELKKVKHLATHLGVKIPSGL